MIESVVIVYINRWGFTAWPDGNSLGASCVDSDPDSCLWAKPKTIGEEEARRRGEEAGTDPDASRSLTGFQAQMNTSDSWPRSTMALFWGISTSPSTSIMSGWLSDRKGEKP